MRNRYLSLFLAILFGMFIISPSFCQTVGIGLSSLYITLSASVGDSVSSTIGVINPSPYAAKAKIYFDCTSCKSDLYFFGTKIGEIIEDPYQLISIDKKEVYVPPNTMGDGIPITITLTPKLILIKYLRLYTPESINFFIKLANKNYPGFFDIPYPHLVIGVHEIRGALTADLIWSSFGKLGVRPAVGATTQLRAYGMPLGSFILIVIGILIIIYVVLKRLKKIPSIKGVVKKTREKRILKSRKTKKK